MLSGRAVVPRGLVTVLEREKTKYNDTDVWRCHGETHYMYADLKIKLIEQEEEDEKSGGGGDQTLHSAK